MSPGRREAWILGAAGLAAAAAGFLAGPALLKLGESGEGEIPSNASFRDLAGHPRRLGEWRGKVLLCNFWATWCAPCREEIPLFIAARQKYAGLGAEFVGIAVDNAAKVREFTASFNIPYPILVANADGLELMRHLGNGSGGLPFTVIADSAGKILQRKLGAFRQAELDQVLGSLGKT